MTGPETASAGRAALFPAPAERARWEDSLTSELAAATARLANGPVTPTFDPARFRHELAAFDFTKPCAIEDVLVWTIAQMEHGIVHITNPRYFGLFNPAPIFPAQCADRIVAAFNPQLATATTSPAAVAHRSACDPFGRRPRRLAARRPPAISPPAERRPTTPP